MNTRRIQTLFGVALLSLAACEDKAATPAAPAAEQPSAPAPVAPKAPEPSAAPELPAVPQGAKVFFIEPADGATVQGPAVDGKVEVAVKMGADSIEVKPAGAVEAGAGHHHIFVDADPAAAGSVVPADAQHLHFGKAQTEAKVALTPGEHTLRLQFADGLHRSYGPQLASQIKITVAVAD